MEEKTIAKQFRIVRISGYLVAGGALAGFSVGVYLMFNRVLFSVVIHISQFEALSYFLTVFLPSFAVLTIIGYVLATTSNLRNTGFSNIVPLSFLSLLSTILSALSIFYIISFLGGLLALVAVTKAYTKPVFPNISKKEAFFLEEIGAMCVTSSSALFLLLWFVSNHFETYAMGLYRNFSPNALLPIVFVSLFVFFAVPLLGSQGTTSWLCGTLGIAISVFYILLIIQNQYLFSNPFAYIGVLMLVSGFIIELVGGLAYLRLFFTKPVAPAIITSTLLYSGRYCPYCGNPRNTVFQRWCSHCGRNLMWAPYAPYCSSCGRLVPANAQLCPHCQDDIRSKRIHFYHQDVQAHSIASKIMKSLGKSNTVENRAARKRRQK